MIDIQHITLGEGGVIIPFSAKARLFSSPEGRKTFWQKHKGKILAGAAAALALGGGAAAVKKSFEMSLPYLAKVAKEVKDRAPQGDKEFLRGDLAKAVDLLWRAKKRYEKNNVNMAIPSTIIADLQEAVKIMKKKAEGEGYAGTYMGVGGGTYGAYLDSLDKQVESCR